MSLISQSKTWRNVLLCGAACVALTVIFFALNWLWNYPSREIAKAEDRLHALLASKPTRDEVVADWGKPAGVLTSRDVERLIRTYPQESQERYLRQASNYPRALFYETHWLYIVVYLDEQDRAVEGFVSGQ